MKGSTRTARVSVYAERGAVPRSNVARVVVYRELEVPEGEVDVEALADAAAELAREAVRAACRRAEREDG